MNVRRGLTRLWIAGSCAWIAVAAFSAYEQHKPMGALDAQALRRLGELEARAAVIEVELPDGTIVEFPANTPRETMRAALARRFGPSQPPAAPAAPQAAPQARQGMFDDLIPPARPAAPVTFDDLIPPSPWTPARIGAFLSAVVTNGILPPVLGYAGLFVLMYLTRWIVAGFRGS